MYPVGRRLGRFGFALRIFWLEFLTLFQSLRNKIVIVEETETGRESQSIIECFNRREGFEFNDDALGTEDLPYTIPILMLLFHNTTHTLCLGTPCSSNGGSCFWINFISSLIIVMNAKLDGQLLGPFSKRLGPLVGRIRFGTQKRH
jgi:hypothetical protein